jgi:hypothetical protein
MKITKELGTARSQVAKVSDDLTNATTKLMDSRVGLAERSHAILITPVEGGLLQMKVANWRFMATRDPKGPAEFRAATDKMKATIAAIEKADLPGNVHALIDPVKPF